MPQIELWTRFGRHLSCRRGAEQLEELLGQLPPGTAIEGDWLQAVGVFFASDITFTGGVQSRHGLDRIEYHRPVRPENAAIDILGYPPDDWRLELFLNGDRVLAISQPEGYTEAVDLRSLGLDERLEFLKLVVTELDHPAVRLLPAAECGFHRAYQAWMLHDFAEGVVIKHRQGRHPAEGGFASQRHLYEWD